MSWSILYHCIKEEIDVLQSMLGNYKFLEMFTSIIFGAVDFVSFSVAFFKWFQHNNATSM